MDRQFFLCLKLDLSFSSAVVGSGVFVCGVFGVWLNLFVVVCGVGDVFRFLCV